METERGARVRKLASVSLWIGIAGLAMLVGYLGLAGVRIVPATEGVPAPPFALRDLDGGASRLDRFDGRVVVLTAWAGWCPPCRAEVPRLNRLHEELGPEGLVVLGLNVEEMSDSELRRSAERLGIDYPVVRPGSEIPAGFGWTGALPTIWLVDRQGRIRGRHEGMATERSLRRACRRLLAERP